MNLDELQSVQARERQSSDLQHLRASFYQEVGEFIADLNQKRARAVETADDPFSEPEVRRLTDDIETAESTVEAIYERRVGKVVKKASIAAAGMPIEDEGLTSEEEALFEDLVERIERNRETVLSVLDGEAPSVSCSIDEESAADGSALTGDPDRPSPEPVDVTAPDETDPDGVSAADLMGDGVDAAAMPPTEPPDRIEGATAEASAPETDTDGGRKTGDVDETAATDVPGTETRPPTAEATSADTGGGDSPPAGDPEPKREVPGVPRTTVRITDDIGEIVGADDRDYELEREDVVTLPEPNADVLVEKNAAERFE